jgi:Fe-S cluster assembly protein SufD
MATVAERHETFAAVFEGVRRDASGAHALGTARKAAYEAFVDRGLPTTREEEWRFTSLAPLSGLVFERPRAASVDAAFVAAIAPTTSAGVSLVLVNGRLVDGMPPSTPAGVAVRTLTSAHPDELLPRRPAGAPVLVDLNTALFEEVVVIEVAPKTVVAAPIVITSVVVPADRPSVVSPRIVLRVGEAAQVSVVEIHAESGTGEPVFVNAVVDVNVAPGALVDHVKVQRQGMTSFHLASMFVETGRAAAFTSHAITLGGRIARNDIVSVLDGEGAECTLNGLYVAGGDSLVDTHTTIDHAKAHCPSHEVYKGILTGRARAVFNGKIVVRQDAQKTDAKQTNKALLLTDDAQINTKPQLEIFADDVKCTHGAAIGQLDEDALFYLKARGVGAVEARNMLIHAFAGDVLDGVKSVEVREAAMARVEEILGLPH